MFAVIKSGGKQYRVAAEDVLSIDKIKGDVGEIVQFGEVLVVGGDAVQLGAPHVAGAMVAAEVLEQGRGPKIIAFKKRRRKNSRRKRGHRQEFTLVRITEILTEGKQPSVQARPKREPRKPEPETTAGADDQAETETKPRRKAKPAAKSPARSPAKAAAKPAKKPAKSASKKPAKAKKAGSKSKSKKS